MNRDFEDFLMNKCLIENPYVLDDESVEFYEDWLQDLEIDDFIKYANQYKQEK